MPSTWGKYHGWPKCYPLALILSSPCRADSTSSLAMPTCQGTSTWAKLRNSESEVVQCCSSTFVWCLWIFEPWLKPHQTPIKPLKKPMKPYKTLHHVCCTFIKQVHHHQLQRCPATHQHPELMRCHTRQRVPSIFVSWPLCESYEPRWKQQLGSFTRMKCPPFLCCDS